MEKNLFTELLHLLEDDSEAAMSQIKLYDDMDYFFEYFSDYLANKKHTTEQKKLYNIFKTKELKNILQLNYAKEYIRMKTIFVHASCYLFDLEPLETETKFNIFIENCNKLVKEKKIDISNPNSIRNSLKEIISNGYYIEDSSILGHKIDSIIFHQKISQYALGILYLIIAESNELPIFGLPFNDKLILTYTKEHCTHNEMVYEDDILFYNIIGEKDLSYTASDIYLTAAIHHEEVSITNLLPKNNANIIKNWIEHILTLPMAVQDKNKLSIKYQHFTTNLREFNFI